MANIVEKRLVDLRPDLPRVQSINAAPVVAGHDLPAMAAIAAVKADPAKSGQILMDAKAAFHGGGTDSMKAVPKTTTSAQPERRAAQEGRPTAAPAAAADSYVRLELHAEGDKLSVVGVHEVAGPLTIPTTVIQGHAYEVLAGDRRVSIGSIPDTTGRHAFANANVAGPQSKHFFIPETSFNFFARIPKAELTSAAVPQLNIVLHRVSAVPDQLSAQPLAKHPGVQTVEVARLPGITLESLSPNVRPQLERIINDNLQKK